MLARDGRSPPQLWAGRGVRATVSVFSGRPLWWCPWQNHLTPPAPAEPRCGCIEQLPGVTLCNWIRANWVALGKKLPRGRWPNKGFKQEDWLRQRSVGNNSVQPVRFCFFTGAVFRLNPSFLTRVLKSPLQMWSPASLNTTAAMESKYVFASVSFTKRQNCVVILRPFILLGYKYELRCPKIYTVIFALYNNGNIW